MGLKFWEYDQKGFKSLRNAMRAIKRGLNLRAIESGRSKGT
jgi:hypothetical protein